MKLTYDVNNSLSAPAASSFFVQAGAPPGPPPGPGPSPGAEPGAPVIGEPSEPKIEITKYSPEIGMETDSVKYPTVEVKNIGGTKLYDVKLLIIGIPSPWIQKITPESIDELAVGNSSIFTIKLRVPSLGEAGEYAGRIVADANVTRDEKPFTISVFTSRAQLIQWEIDRLEKALRDLEVDVENAKKSGKDVSEVLPYIESVKEQIDLAEDYLSKKMYDEALSAVQTGWTFLERARYYLSIAPFIEILIETIFPPWLIILLIILVATIIILVFFVKRMKGVFDRIFRIQVPQAPGMLKPGARPKPSVLMEKMEERGKLEKEAANIKRVINLLEREHREGLITDNAYNDLKRRNEEKLKKVEGRLSAIK